MLIVFYGFSRRLTLKSISLPSSDVVILLRFTKATFDQYCDVRERQLVISPRTWVCFSDGLTTRSGNTAFKTLDGSGAGFLVF